MIRYKKNMLQFAEVWFDEPLTGSAPDILLLQQCDSQSHSGRCTDFHTILVDLTADEDQLLAGMAKNTQYEIRRAIRSDGLSFDYFQGDACDVMEEFCVFFDAFAQQKNIPLAPRQRLLALAESGMLVLARAKANEESLVWHAYLFTPHRVRLLHSASLFREKDNTLRSLIGRANRTLHYQAMLWFKHLCVKYYDFGGWYEGKTDEEKLKINQFKESFGGEVVKNFNFEQAGTIKGRVALPLRRLLSTYRARSSATRK